jgi:Na+/proline symporter
LCSTFDSGLSATSSLFTIDVLKSPNDEKSLKYSRLAMIGITGLGLLVALAANYIPGFGLKHLWWIFNTIAACVVVPTILSLYWEKLSAKGVFWGVLVAFFVGIPLFVYGNVIDNAYWIVFSSLGIIGVSTLFCVLFSVRRKDKIPSYLSG